MERSALLVAACCVLAAAVAGVGNGTADRSGGEPPPHGFTGAPESGVSGAFAVDETTPLVGDPSSAILTRPATNTTAYLTIPAANVSNATSTSVGLDVGGALAVDSVAASGVLRAETVDARLSRANTTAAQQVVLRESGTAVERRIDALAIQQRVVIAEYASDERSTREFVGALARIQTRAERLGGVVSRIESAAASVPGASLGGSSIQSWARDRRVELGQFTGPVRSAIVSAQAGDDPVTVYAEVTPDDVVLATITNGRYLREAYVPSDRAGANGSSESLESVSEALSRAREQYPWAWNHSTSVQSAGGPGVEGYRITIFHQQGRLTTSLDPGSGTVFHEIQVNPLAALPTRMPRTATDEGLRLHVNRTHPTGPMNVSVAERPTREPVNATVFVDGRPIGAVGSDGYRWTIAPRERVNVTASDGERTATVQWGSNATTVEDPTAGTALDPAEPGDLAATERAITGEPAGSGTANGSAAGNGTSVASASVVTP